MRALSTKGLKERELSGRFLVHCYCSLKVTILINYITLRSHYLLGSMQVFGRGLCEEEEVEEGEGGGVLRSGMYVHGLFRSEITPLSSTYNISGLVGGYFFNPFD